MLTVGDSRPETGGATGDTYRMVGIPDGVGAFDNGDRTFTVLMNHELSAAVGTVRDHGSVGAFVSRWVVRKSDLAVLSGDDQIQQVKLYDATLGAYVSGTTAFDRLCSADLPDASAFFNSATGKGTTERIFMTGEEARPPFSTRHGRAFGTVVTGSGNGTSYELPRLGKMSYENVVASPFRKDKTIVVSLDDSTNAFTANTNPADPTGAATQPSEVYVYVGTKQTTGSEVDKAGLTNGLLYGVKVTGAANESGVANGQPFTMHNFGDVSAKSGAELQAESVAAGVTQFRRVEDGQWDPASPRDFYYLTTDAFGGTTRMWRLRLNDVRNPEAGGKISVVVDSPAGVPGEMFDNMTIDRKRHALIQEDTGNQAYLSKIWQHDLAEGNNNLVQVAEHNPDLFLDTDPATPGVQPVGDLNERVPGQQGTQDEETSGIIDVSHILGAGTFVADVQSHLAHPDPELVEHGQWLVMRTNVASAEVVDGVLKVQGTVNDDDFDIDRVGTDDVKVTFNGKQLGRFDLDDFDAIEVDAGAGTDDVGVGSTVAVRSLLVGGLGDDVLHAGGGRSILVGGDNEDNLRGGSRDDILVGDTLALTDDELSDALAVWAGGGSYATRVNALRPTLAPAIEDDLAVDRLTGAGGTDWFLPRSGDKNVDRSSGELVG